MTEPRHTKQRVVAPRLRITVTAASIADGVARDSSGCMISDAIKTAYPDYVNVETDLGTIRITDPIKRLRYIYLTPRVAGEALVDFDAGIDPQPFKFELRTPAKILRSGKTEEEKQATRLREREYRKQKRDRRTQEEREEQIVSDMNNPDKPLRRPTVAYTRSQTTHEKPIIVGGRAPPRRQLTTKRQFGLRFLRR